MADAILVEPIPKRSFEGISEGSRPQGELGADDAVWLETFWPDGRVVDHSPGEVCVREVCADEIGSAQVSLVQAAVVEVRLLEVCSRQVGGAEVGVARVGADEHGVPEIGLIEGGVDEHGFAKGDTGEVSVRQVGTEQIGAVEVREVQIDFGEVREPETHIVEQGPVNGECTTSRPASPQDEERDVDVDLALLRDGAVLHEQTQHLLDGLAIGRGGAGDSFEGVDPAESNVKARIAEVGDGARERAGDLAGPVHLELPPGQDGADHDNEPTDSLEQAGADVVDRLCAIPDWSAGEIPVEEEPRQEQNGDQHQHNHGDAERPADDPAAPRPW